MNGEVHFLAYPKRNRSPAKGEHTDQVEARFEPRGALHESKPKIMGAFQHVQR